MLPTTFLAIILAFWSSLHLAHTFIINNSYLGPKLLSFLLRHNITITFFNLRWFTTRWNHFFLRVGTVWSKKLRLWFNAGVIFALIAMVTATVLLCHALFVSVNEVVFKPMRSVPDSQPVLTVIVPGVNMPLQDAWYLLSAVLISGILHEAGHAVAATRERVQVNGFGVFAFIIYPGAYVDLNSDDMRNKEPLARLRVYCAGVWHNFIICLLVSCFILLLPVMLMPFYINGGMGALVTHQSPKSPLLGDMGIQIADHVIQIDGCLVTNTYDWFYCINKTKKSTQWGSCTSFSKIKKLDSHTKYNKMLSSDTTGSSSWEDCCSEEAPHTHLCYQYNYSKESIFACLPGRAMLVSGTHCSSNRDCMSSNDENICVTAHTEPGIRFMHIVVMRQQTSRHNILYVGDPNDVVRNVIVTDMSPRHAYLPIKLPGIFLRFLQYMFSMSGALALLNIIPCYALDGQWAFEAFLDYFDSNRFISSNKYRITRTTLLFGTILLAANILFGFIHVLSR